MHESAPTTVPAFPPGRSRRRKRWLLAAIPLCLLFSAVVLSFYGLFSSNHQLQKAIAEADRLDPGWRQAALEAKRAVIPDAQNSGTHIINAKRLLPPQWPYWDFSGSKIAENQPKEEI